MDESDKPVLGFISIKLQNFKNYAFKYSIYITSS